jgi:hypothetical protein
VLQKPFSRHRLECVGVRYDGCSLCLLLELPWIYAVVEDTPGLDLSLSLYGFSHGLAFRAAWRFAMPPAEFGCQGSLQEVYGR